MPLAFIEVDPAAAATRLDAESIHLWRIPYTSSQGRAPLLSLLGAYLGIPAPAVMLEPGARGKPRFAHSQGVPCNTDGFEFNWSHSGSYALIAIARDVPLGVDIERAARKPRVLEIARRFFDPGEADALAAIDPDARNSAFISLWCAKEAVLKAAGEGLSFGLARLGFAHVNSHDWQLVRIDPVLGQPEDWQLAGFETVTGYHGALAWRGKAREILAFRTQNA